MPYVLLSLLCVGVVILFTMAGYIVRVRQFRKFFFCIGFYDFTSTAPLYLGNCKVNRYLRTLRFYSKIPLCEWQKIAAVMEVFLKKRIHKIELYKENLRMIEVFLVQKKLSQLIAWNDEFLEPDDIFAIGESYEGKVVWNARVHPHGLIGGATGGGKTALIRCIIHQAIHKKYNITVFDFKGGGDYSREEDEISKYSDLEHGYGSFLVSDIEETRNILCSLLVEVRGRLESFKQAGVSNIEEYNASGAGRFVPWLIVIDEAAEILDVKPLDKAQKETYAEINQTLRTLARISRATGVHILMGLIRPSADILNGQIKNNLVWRVCGYFADPAASRIVLDNDRATELPPDVKGRFVVMDKETQAYYLPIVSEDD